MISVLSIRFVGLFSNHYNILHTINSNNIINSDSNTIANNTIERITIVVLQKTLKCRFKCDQLMVRVGSNSALSGGDVLFVDSLYFHPMYHKLNNDVALLKTSQSLLDNSMARLIPIATESLHLGTEANFILWNKVSIRPPSHNRKHEDEFMSCNNIYF